MLVALALAASASPQQLSTDVYPSEEELQVGLDLGQLQCERWRQLQELMLGGIDATQGFLLDEIPNQAYFDDLFLSPLTALQQEQQAPFIRASKPKPASGSLSYSFAQKLEESGDSRYRTRLQYRQGRFSGRARLQNEYSSAERVTERVVQYDAPKSWLHRAAIGNYTTRFGLGGCVGYRGRLLSPMRELGSETVLYPEYGGFNGLLANIGSAALSADMLASVTRDDSHQIGSLATQLSRRRKSATCGLVIGYNWVRNRLRGGVARWTNLSGWGRYQYHSGVLALEGVSQFHQHRTNSALLIEGWHSVTSAKIQYAAWVYNGRFLDITSGSKGGRAGRAMVLEEAGFEFRSRRAGQEGILVRTTINWRPNWQQVSSLLYSWLASDTADFQALAGVMYDPGSGCSVRLDYLNSTRKRIADSPPVKREHQFRLECRGGQQGLAWRGSIGYHTANARKDYLSAQVRLTWRPAEGSSLQGWCQLARIDPGKLDAKYWYLYALIEETLLENVAVAMKISHRNNSSARLRRQSTASVEVRVEW